jgi:tripartite-type tricarboxylate transporter receptor subunit TctC
MSEHSNEIQYLIDRAAAEEQRGGYMSVRCTWLPRRTASGRDALAGALIRNAGAALLAFVLATPALAQSWPARSVRVVVPYSPGGGVDTVGRLMAQKLTENTGVSFLIDNRTGAGGIIGTEAVVRSGPDGHTLLLSASEFGINPAVRTKLPYDPLKDFAFISQVALVKFILVGHPSVPVRNLKELIALAKARPGELTYGSSGMGSGPHFSGEMLQMMTGIRWLHVPFKGAAPAAVALIAGEIGFLFSSTINLMPHIRTGRLRPIAVTGEQRYSELPDVPTFTQVGLSGFDPPLFYGMYAPAATPPDVVRRIHAAAARAMNAADLKEKLARTGGDFPMSTPEEFGAYLRKQIPEWTRVAKQANIRVD